MLWLIGGTSDSVIVARHLLATGKPFIVSVASDSGKALFEQEEGIQCVCGKYTHGDFQELFVLNDIHKVIDASHPFAENVKENAKRACEALDIPYIRYERKDIHLEHVIRVKDYDEAGSELAKMTGNVLLTTGANHLHIFKKWIGLERLYARILPRNESLDIAYDLGFKMDQIIAMKGPFSVEMNEVMLSAYNIQALVTKDSGPNGGVEEKIEACINKGIKCILIDRPQIEYKTVVYDLDDLEQYL